MFLTIPDCTKDKERDNNSKTRKGWPTDSLGVKFWIPLNDLLKFESSFKLAHKKQINTQNLGVALLVFCTIGYCQKQEDIYLKVTQTAR